MKQVFRLLLLVLTACLAACGSGVNRPDSFPKGYVNAQGDRVALAVPPHYTSIVPSPEDFRALANRMKDNNPFLAERMNQMADEIKDDTLRLAAYHEDGLTTIVVTSERVPALHTTSAQAAANRDGLEEAGYEIIKVDEVTINGQDAERTQAEIQIHTELGSLQFMLLQYTFVKGGRAYSISFGTPSVQFEELKPEFEQIAGTFYTTD